MLIALFLGIVTVNVASGPTKPFSSLAFAIIVYSFSSSPRITFIYLWYSTGYGIAVVIPSYLGSL